MKYRFNIFCIGLLLLLNSCIESIEFDTGTNESVLVIDGKFTNYQGDQVIRLSRTTDFGESVNDPVRNAIIKIIRGDGLEAFYKESVAGNYLLPRNVMPAITNAKYKLEITLSDGSMYQSANQRMPALVEADSAFYAVETQTNVSEINIINEFKVINVYVSTPIPQNEKAYFRWEVDEAFEFWEQPCGGLHVPKACYFGEKPETQNILLFDNEDFVGSTLNPIRVAQNRPIVDYKYLFTHYFNIYQHRISKEAYDYWQDIQLIANQTGTIFDPPPAGIPGNVFNVEDEDELILGFFEVASVDTVRTYTIRSFLAEEFQLNYYCTGRIFGFLARNSPSACCACQTLQESMLPGRPYYWRVEDDE